MLRLGANEMHLYFEQEMIQDYAQQGPEQIELADVRDLDDDSNMEVKNIK